MDRPPEIATVVESTAESLITVLDPARLAQPPAVPPAQLRVLAVLERTRHTTISRLADALGVVPSSASRLCDRLEATGLLRRVPDPRDRREVRLHLTPAARRLTARLRERRCTALAEVLERMTPEERDCLARGLAAFDAAVGGTAAAVTDDLQSA